MGIYDAFGLRISSDIELPFLKASTAWFVKREPDLEIHWSIQEPEDDDSKEKSLYVGGERGDGKRPYFTVAFCPDLGVIRCRHSGDKGDATFLIDSRGSGIAVTASPKVDITDVISYLTGPVMGCALRLRGKLCLHGAAVEAGDGAIAILGPKGSGKSTLAAALAQRGYPVLTDDIAVVQRRHGRFYAMPAYPRLRVWPESQQFVPDWQSDCLPRVLSVLDKRYQLLSAEPSAPEWRFSTRPVELRSVYLLGYGEGAARIDRLAPAPSTMALQLNIYAPYITDRQLRTRDFSFLASLAAGVPVCRAEAPEGRVGFEQRLEAILDHASLTFNPRARLTRVDSHSLLHQSNGGVRDRGDSFGARTENAVEVARV